MLPRLLEMDNQPYFDKVGEAINNAQPIQINIMPFRAFVLVGLIQLALRHPNLKDDQPTYQIGLSLAERLQERLGDENPIIAEALELGWSKELDVPLPKPNTKGCKYSDLDPKRRWNIFANSTALAIAFEMIAEMSGRSADEIQSDIGKLASSEVHQYSQSDVDQVIDELDEQVNRTRVNPDAN